MARPGELESGKLNASMRKGCASLLRRPCACRPGAPSRHLERARTGCHAFVVYSYADVVGVWKGAPSYASIAPIVRYTGPAAIWLPVGTSILSAVSVSYVSPAGRKINCRRAVDSGDGMLEQDCPETFARRFFDRWPTPFLPAKMQLGRAFSGANGPCQRRHALRWLVSAPCLEALVANSWITSAKD